MSLNHPTFSCRPELQTFLQENHAYIHCMNEEEKIIESDELSSLQEFMNSKEGLTQKYLNAINALKDDSVMLSFSLQERQILKSAVENIKNQLNKTLSKLKQKEQEKLSLIETIQGIEQTRQRGAFYTRHGVTTRTQSVALNEAV